jgi:hypothetical protein
VKREGCGKSWREQSDGLEDRTEQTKGRIYCNVECCGARAARSCIILVEKKPQQGDATPAPISKALVLIRMFNIKKIIKISPAQTDFYFSHSNFHFYIIKNLKKEKFTIHLALQFGRNRIKIFHSFIKPLFNIYILIRGRY